MTERKKPRTFKVGRTTMSGDDVKAWQQDVDRLFKTMGINCPIQHDGKYAQATRGFTASLCRAMGLESAEKAMADGVTPDLRIKLRNKRLTAVERNRYNSKERAEYRKDLRSRWNIRVYRPVRQIITDDWGYVPGGHDGIDVVCPDDSTLYAMVRAKVIDVREDDWWGLGAPKNPTEKDKGDGIIQLRVLDGVGPFTKGYHIGYGHAEHPCVEVDQIVEPGQPIGKAGLANVSHIHLMLNTGKTKKGVGNKDPRAILDYSIKHG
jgi:murein DD-endopeptidase MepM/ murein hydrolase activator NlpD